jgi:hypothetical protein
MTSPERKNFHRMNFTRLSCAALLAGQFFCLNKAAAADPLDPYRWKSRVIVLSLPVGEARVQLAASLSAGRVELDERDLKVVDVSPGSARIPGTVRLNPMQTAALREKFKLHAKDEEAVFILIGKDGGEKARQRGKLRLANWFTLIDGMPMRRDEIQRQRKERE